MNAPRFSIIPAGAVTDRSLEARDLQVLCLLGRHTDKAGWCVRSQVRMAREINTSRASLQNSLDRLCEAGWLEKKRLDTEVEQAGGRPSRSYAYRVCLDRDDYAFESLTRDTEEDAEPSHAETASEGVGCQPVGTPLPTDWHPGATPCVGTGANTYVGTKNVPLERPPIERERDARARDLKDRKARFIAAFEQRWPTAAADDRQRTGYAAEALTEDEEKAALAGIGPFLENLKRLGRKNTPAGWRYLEERRWTLLDAKASEAAQGPQTYSPDSPEAKAVLVLHEIVGRSAAFFKIWRRPDGSVSYPKPITPRLAALAQAPERQSEWPDLTHAQAGAWESLLREVFDDGLTRNRLREGSKAPWPWPPSVDGKLYTQADAVPPLTNEDLEALSSEGQK